MNCQPAPVFRRLIEVNAPELATGGRAYLDRQHRPLICYGFKVVTFDVAIVAGLRNGPSGLPNSGAPPFDGWVTLVEWDTMDRRHDRVPLAAADQNWVLRQSGVDAEDDPTYQTAPFLVDLAASYVELPAFAVKVPIILLEFATVPADPANIRAAGLRVPANLPAL